MEVHIIFVQDRYDADNHKTVQQVYSDKDKAEAEAKFIEVESKGTVWAEVKTFPVRK